MAHIASGRHYWDDFERRKWQNPEEILTGIGLKPGMTFADIGCGGGFFTIPAARIVGQNGKVYGLDANATVLASLQENAKKECLQNIILTIGKAEETIICHRCADIVFFGIALHDFQEPSLVLKNSRQIIKPDGKLIDLDWKKEGIPIGPPSHIKFDEAKASGLIRKAGYVIESVKDSGPYHYLITAALSQEKKS